MKLLDLLENRPTDRPLKGAITDNLKLAIKEIAFLQARLKQLPDPEKVDLIDQQLQALGRSYQAEIWERKKQEVQSS